MKKRYGIMLFLIVMMAVVFMGSKTASAKTVDVPVRNDTEPEISVYVGDSGTIQPIVTATDLTEDAEDAEDAEDSEDSTVYQWSYDSYDDDIVEVNETSGQYKALAAGITTVRVRGYSQYGRIVFFAECSFTVTIDMTNVTISKTSIHSYLLGGYDYISEKISLNSEYVLNEDDGSDFSYVSSNKKMIFSCSLSANTLLIKCSSAGTATLTITINGKTFVIKVKINYIKLSKNTQVIANGKKFRLKLKGTSERAKWTSTNSKVAKVSSNGTVKCRKKGNAVITATIGGKKVGCAVSVVSAKMLKVIKRAEKIGSTWTYSQPKRMQSGYYDCSSLVWKAYSLMGKKFGLANYAPVAADLAKWCKQHGKSLTKSYTSKDIQKMRFNPGDLMFETGSNNGRYKGIYHVEMFVGYRVYSYSKNGTPQLVERWAARPDNYYEGGGWMMRP